MSREPYGLRAFSIYTGIINREAQFAHQATLFEKKVGNLPYEIKKFS